MIFLEDMEEFKDEYFEEDFNTPDEEFSELEFELQDDFAYLFPTQDKYIDIDNLKVVSDDGKSVAEKDKKSFMNMNFRQDSNGNYRVKAEDDMFCESFYLEPGMLYDASRYDRFIAGCEKCVRTSQMYSAYIAYLKNEVGLNRDAFNSNIDQEMATLEMHHGPIFTLYDYVTIMIEYALANNIPANTFTIAKMVMDEHAANRVQVVMLTQNNHALVHANKLFLDFRQCHGSLKEFIQIYGNYIKRSPRLLRKIESYRQLIETGNLHDTSFIDPDAILNWSIKQTK